MILASTARDLHVVVGWSVIFANGIAGFWALAAHYRRPFQRAELWGLVIVAQALVTAQAVIGVVIQSQEDLEPPDFHLLYGFTMLAVVMILYGYRAQIPHLRYLLYAGGSLFLMGLGIRAMVI